jgi:hypothetical protein
MTDISSFCDSTDETTLKSYDDWSNLNFDFRSGGGFDDGLRHSVSFEPEMTSQDLINNRNSAIDSINQKIQNLPNESFVSDPDTSRQTIDDAFAELLELTDFNNISNCELAQAKIAEIESLLDELIVDSVQRDELFASLAEVSDSFAVACDVGESNHSEDLLNNVLGSVESLADDGTLNKGNANSLSSKIDNALKSIENGNNVAACGQLGAAENEINAMISGNKITESHADSLLDILNSVSSQICS